jgi:hypothetical protein
LFPNAGDIHRLDKARDYGCNVGEASTLGDLIDILGRWGINKEQAARTLDDYDRVIRQNQSDIILDAPVGYCGSPPAPLIDGEGPFYVMEVQPS